MNPPGRAVSAQRTDDLVLLPDPATVPHLSIVPTTDGHPGIRLVGELDVCCTDRLATALAEWAGGSEPVHVDLADLTFIDVAGARALVAAGRDLRAGSGGGLVLTSPPQVAVDVLQLFVTGRSLRAGEALELPGPGEGRR